MGASLSLFSVSLGWFGRAYIWVRPVGAVAVLAEFLSVNRQFLFLYRFDAHVPIIPLGASQCTIEGWELRHLREANG